jgi:hypothetical protein
VGALPEDYMQSYQRWPRVGLYDLMHACRTGGGSQCPVVALGYCRWCRLTERYGSFNNQGRLRFSRVIICCRMKHNDDLFCLTNKHSGNACVVAQICGTISCHRAVGTLPENYMQSYQRWPRVGLCDCAHVESVVVANVQ